MKKKEKASIQNRFFQKNKSLMFVFLAILFLTVSGSQATVFEPEWTEFCPPKYCESNENVFSKDATYWYKRRLQFEKSLQKCSTSKGAELENCYNEIREVEARKNKVWDVRQEEKTRTTEYNREYYMEKMKYDGINRMLETVTR